MKKILPVFVSIYLALIFFMPKTNIWFSGEKLLKNSHIVFSDEKVNDFGFFFSLKNANVYYDGLKSFTLKEAIVLPYLFFNQIILKDFKSSKDIGSALNLSISSLKFTNSVLKPFFISIEGRGDIGNFNGEIDIKKRILKVMLSPSESFLKNVSLRKYFKKSKEGYIYEYRF